MSGGRGAGPCQASQVVPDQTRGWWTTSCAERALRSFSSVSRGAGVVEPGLRVWLEGLLRSPHARGPGVPWSTVAGRWKLEGSSCPHCLDAPFCCSVKNARSMLVLSTSSMLTSCCTAREERAAGSTFYVLGCFANLNSVFTASHCKPSMWAGQHITSAYRACLGRGCATFFAMCMAIIAMIYIIALHSMQ